jgi:predicted RNase H-like nuclease (RuvC/YqgF family)
MKKLVVRSVLPLFGGALLLAQADGRPKPSSDELTAYLKLSSTQVACLESNRDKFRETIDPSMDQLRELTKQMRQEVRDGKDTAAIQKQIESLQASISKTRSSYVASAQACVGGAAAVKELVAAETLMTEVRQAMGMLLLEPTDSGGGGRGTGMHRRGPRGPQ